VKYRYLVELLLLWLITGCATFLPAAVTTPTFVPAPTAPQQILPAGQGPGTLANYRLQVTLDYIGHRVQVEELVRIINPGPDHWDKLVFYLPPALRDTDRFTISTAQLQQNTQTQAPNVEVDPKGYIIFSLPGYVRPNAEVTVRIAYGLKAQYTILLARRPLGDVGYSDQLIQFHEWYPRLVPYQPNVGWIKWETTSVGPPIFAEIADYELQVQAPNGVIVASGGLVAQSGETWRFAMQNARSIAFTASPDYVVQSKTVRGVRVDAYGFAADVDLQLPAVLETAEKALNLYSDRFGKYPYNSLVIARNAYTSTNASGGFLSHSGRSYAEYTGQEDTLLQVSIALGLGEMWWQQFVGQNPIVEPWVGGGLAMYSELLFHEAYNPNLVDWYWRNRIDYWQPTGALNRSAYDLKTTESLLRNVYRIGARFLAELRSAMGDEAFMAFLQDYFQSSAFRLSSSTDFWAAVRKHAPLDYSDLQRKYFDSNIPLPTPYPSLTPVPTAGPSPTATLARIHVVKPNETLSDVAWLYGISMRAIMDINGMRGDPIDVILRPGQQLIIPYK
jgi:hypothetical protein